MAVTITGIQEFTTARVMEDLTVAEAEAGTMIVIIVMIPGLQDPSNRFLILKNKKGNKSRTKMKPVKKYWADNIQHLK
jgi:hypothetical protein